MPSDVDARVFDDTFWQAFAHEVRTSLNHVCGGVELVLEGATGPLPPDARAALDDVALAARHMFATTDALLALAGSDGRPGDHDLFTAVRVAAEASVGTSRLRVRAPAGRTLVRSTAGLLAELARAAVAWQVGDRPATLALRAIEADGRLWIQLAHQGRCDGSGREPTAWSSAVGRQICAWLGVVWREGAGEISLGLPPARVRRRD
jgi:signal transduction histidine kinase